MPIKFTGSIRELRHGGWRARGMLVAAKHGMLVETQVGPRAFASEAMCDAWLRDEAARRAIHEVDILVIGDAELPTS